MNCTTTWQKGSEFLSVYMLIREGIKLLKSSVEEGACCLAFPYKFRN